MFVTFPNTQVFIQITKVSFQIGQKMIKPAAKKIDFLTGLIAHPRV